MTISDPASNSADRSGDALPYADAATVRRLLPYADAVDAIEAALREGEAGAHDPPRSVVGVAGGQLLLMPSESPAYVGVKLSTVAPGNARRGRPRIQGLYALFDAATLAPLAVLDAVELTVIRTSATSALSSRYLARPEADSLVVFGTGPQAWGHVLAHRAVRPIRRVGVVGRTPERRRALVERVGALGIDAYAATADDVAGADIVCACTTARRPLFDGRRLPPQVHVVAVGSHEADAREIDAATLRGALLVVEDREVAWREAGDLVLARAEGAIDDASVAADLRELVAGKLASRGGGRSVFKSVGAAFEDLATAALVYARMTARC